MPGRGLRGAESGLRRRGQGVIWGAFYEESCYFRSILGRFHKLGVPFWAPHLRILIITLGPYWVPLSFDVALQYAHGPYRKCHVS